LFSAHSSRPFPRAPFPSKLLSRRTPPPRFRLFTNRLSRPRAPHPPLTRTAGTFVVVSPNLHRLRTSSERPLFPHTLSCLTNGCANSLANRQLMSSSPFEATDDMPKLKAEKPSKPIPPGETPPPSQPLSTTNRKHVNTPPQDENLPPPPTPQNTPFPYSSTPNEPPACALAV